MFGLSEETGSPKVVFLPPLRAGTKIHLNTWCISSNLLGPESENNKKVMTYEMQPFP